MAFICRFCSKCGKRFINPTDDDFNDLCPICRESDQSVGKEINDTFSQEEVRKIIAGPNGQQDEGESLDIGDLFDDDDSDDDDLDYQDFDEQLEFEVDEDDY